MYIINLCTYLCIYLSFIISLSLVSTPHVFSPYFFPFSLYLYPNVLCFLYYLIISLSFLVYLFFHLFYFCIFCISLFLTFLFCFSFLLLFPFLLYALLCEYLQACPSQIGDALLYILRKRSRDPRSQLKEM